MTEQKTPQEHKVTVDFEDWVFAGILLLFLSSIAVIPSIVYFSAKSEAKVSICKAIALRESEESQVLSSFRRCLGLAE